MDGRKEFDARLVDLTVFEDEPSEARSRLTSSLGGRARVEEALTILAGLCDRDVAVAEDDEFGLGEASPEPAGAPLARAGVVHHRHLHAGELEAEFERERPDELVVVIPEHDVDGSECLELAQGAGGDHVAGVQDDVAGGERLHEGGRERREPAPQVSVGKDDDLHDAARVRGPAEEPTGPFLH